MSIPRKNFHLTHDKYSRGFHMKFDNGWTISVQWGRNNYCEARGDTSKDDSKTAEIAFFDPDNKMHWMKEWGDQVVGWLKPDEVLFWMKYVSALDPGMRYTKSPYQEQLDSEDD